MSSFNALLAGRSLLLSVVAASLAEAPGVSLSVTTGLAQAAACLKEARPEVLIFDLAELGNAETLSALLSFPGLSLIGLDSELNRAIVLSGREFRALTLQQIRELVTAVAARPAGA